MSVFIVIVADEADFIGFQLNAVVQIAGLDAVIAFGAALGIDLAFFLPFAQLSDFIVEAQVAIEAFGIERSFRHGLADGAAFVVLMLAVLVAAVQGDLIDVGKTFAQRVFIGPHLDLAHAGVIDDESALGQWHEFAGGGGVAAFAGDFVDFIGPLPFLAVELIDQSGLAHAAGADDAHGGAAFQVTEQNFEPGIVQRAGDVDGGIRAERVQDLRSFLILRFRIKVGLIEQNHRLGPGALDEREVALHAARIEVLTRIRDHGHDVDVRADDLFLRALAGHFARKARLTWQARADHMLLVFPAELHRDPVAYGG